MNELFISYQKLSIQSYTGITEENLANKYIVLAVEVALARLV